MNDRSQNMKRQSQEPFRQRQGRKRQVSVKRRTEDIIERENSQESIESLRNEHKTEGSNTRLPTIAASTKDVMRDAIN
jgi:hypothetical protein